MEAWLLRALGLGRRAKIADWPGAVTIPAEIHTDNIFFDRKGASHANHSPP